MKKSHPTDNNREINLSQIGYSDKYICLKISAVTEAGKVGGQLAKDFFKEEYMLNSKIGKYSQEMHNHLVIKLTSSWRDLFVCLFNITKTCPCNIYRFFQL